MTNADTLLVFGYSCKLFRDDEKAKYIDEGRHLIPWMGDATHKIDRYDGRAAIANLQQYEAIDGLSAERVLTADEMQEERLCDEERYRSLVEEEVDLDAREEEENKRSSDGGQFHFDYGQISNSPSSVEDQQAGHGELPSIRTLAHCIERTAGFIAKQGAQMEILMRAKEASNPKFQFLNPENPYNSIYKEVLEAKRNRSQKSSFSSSAYRELTLEELETSLRTLTANLPTSAPGLKSEAAASSGSAFSQLVERIRLNKPQPQEPPPVQPEPEQNLEATQAAPDGPQTSREESEAPAHIVEVTPPPIAMQPLIDQTAFYVAKNGADMMTVVKKREPDKFAFLKEGNKFNTFFLYKVSLYKEMLAEKQAEIESLRGRRDSTQVVGNKFPSLKGFFR